MLKFFFQFFLTFSASSIIFLFYAIKNKITLSYFIGDYNVFYILPEYLFCFLSYFIYFMIILFINVIALYSIRYTTKDFLNEEHIENIELKSDIIISNYFVYFLISMLANDNIMFLSLYFLFFLFTFLSKTTFNPIFLMFGYKFYTIKTKRGSVISLISKKSYKTPLNINIKKLYRLNDYTFMQ